MLEGGQVDGALAEILRLPDHDAATKWIGLARRYVAGRGALDRIETAALLDPAVTAPIAPVRVSSVPAEPLPTASASASSVSTAPTSTPPPAPAAKMPPTTNH
jgi:hypothetical protein